MKKMDMQTKNKVIVIVLTVFTVLLLIGLTYTFFITPVSNTNNEKIQTQTATMSLEFDDNDNGVSGTLNLGQSIVKKFTLENTGTVDAYGQINWYNLVNTYTPESLSWTLEQSTTENGTYTTIGTGKVPASSTSTIKKLKSGILVPVSTTYYYKLTITLNNLDINQSSDINASMHSQFSLVSSSEPGANTILNLVSGEPTNTTAVITKPAPSGANCTNTLAYDGTTDNNLRYVGANPCNYVTFNGETAGWRIVGIMNNVEDGTGNLETRIKLIRNESLGNYSWDTSQYGLNGATSNFGINDWTQADLKNELNGDYLDTTLGANTNWYNAYNNTQTGVYDYTKGLSQAAQDKIEDAKWYLGGTSWNTADSPGQGTASNFYGYERGTEVWGSTSGQTCNDVYCPRAINWTGKVALIYPSDYGYAVGGTVRSTCLSKNLITYSDDCYSNDWLNANDPSNWLLSPDSGNSYYAWYVELSGNLSNGVTSIYAVVKPAVYLKSETSISGGNGSVSEPYVLG